MRLPLCGGRDVFGRGRTQVTKARRCDDREARLDERPAELQTLIESATGAMDEEDRWTVSGDGILDRTARRIGQAADRMHARVGLREVVAVVLIGAGRGEDRCRDQNATAKVRGAAEPDHCCAKFIDDAGARECRAGCRSSAWSGAKSHHATPTP
jgi:hypothetical protein